LMGFSSSFYILEVHLFILRIIYSGEAFG